MNTELYNTVIDVLAIIPPILGFLGLAYIIMQLIRGLLAERHLSVLLAREMAQDQELVEIRNRLKGRFLDMEAANEAHRRIEILITQLDKEDQKQIRESLTDSSERSRASYIAKLLTHAKVPS